MTKKHAFYLLLMMIIGVGFGSFLWTGISHGAIFLDRMKNNEVISSEIPVENILPKKDENKETTLTFVGDIMLDRGVAYSVKNNFGGDYSQLFANISPLAKSDILFANLEGPASDVGVDAHNLYSFRMTPEAPQILKNAGFNIVSFANNHVGDWGRPAFEDTMARMKTAGLLFTGAGMNKSEAETPTIIIHNGVKFGFLGFTDIDPSNFGATDTSSGILLASDPDYSNIISNASKQVDVLIVSMHWGEEYKEHTERQTMLGHMAIDAGAKLVIGMHPHVIQQTEEYKNGYIAYSLGNFIFDLNFSKETMHGLALTVTMNGTNIDHVEKSLVTSNKYFQPETIEPYTNTTH